MSKTGSLIVAVATLLSAVPAAAQATVLGPEAAACRAGGDGAAVLVHVDGFKQRTGNLRVQVYGANPADWLAKGKKLKRVDLPVTRAGAMDVCVALPGQGNYAVAVRHDVEGSGKSDWNDGAAFSRNPRLSLLSYKPDYDDVMIRVGAGVRDVPVVLNYRRGLSIGPVASAER